MSKSKDKSNIFLYIIVGILLLSFIQKCNDDIEIDEVLYDNTFRIISSTSTSMVDDEIISYGKKNHINIEKRVCQNSISYHDFLKNFLQAKNNWEFLQPD